MKLGLRYFMFFTTYLLSNTGFAKEFFEDRERGWYWFEENKISELKEPLKKETVSSSSFDPNQEMEKLQKSIQGSLNRAILMPTENNIQNYLNLQIKAFNLSQRFTAAAKVLQVKYPVLDYQIEAPYHHNARIIKNQQDRELAEQSVKRLASTYGLFYFFDSTCPYCGVMAPNVTNFANKHGWHVIPVSTDGGVLKEFPNAVPDNGIANAFGVTHLPALFAVNPNTREILKLSNRVTSITELEDVVLRYERQNKDGQNGH